VSVSVPAPARRAAGARPLPAPALRARLPALWPSLLLYLGVAVVIDLGSMHRLHTADDLVFVLASLYAWTPFFWEQDRVGLLLPLAASPCGDPLVNLLVQNALSIFAGLAATLLLCRYLFREPFYPLVAAVANAGLVAFAPADFRYNLLINCCYGTAMSLGVGGLLLTEPGPSGRVGRPRLLAALLLVSLSEWVYLGNALLLLPLAVLRAGLKPGRPLQAAWRAVRSDPEARAALAVLAIGTAVGVALKALGTAETGPDGSTPIAGLYAQHWPWAWGRLAANLWEALAAGPWLVVLLAAAAAGLLGLGRDGRSAAVKSIHCAAAAALLAGLANALFLGTRTWLFWNQFAYRYLLPSFLCAQVGLMAVALGPLAGRLKGHARLLSPIGGVLVLAAALAADGWPSLARVRADLDGTLGRCTADVTAGDCEFICGDYYQVWPAVYHANLVLHERGEDRTVWGVAKRGQPMSHRWQALPPAERRIAVPRGYREVAAEQLDAFGFGPRVAVGERPTIEILAAVPPHR
jgi:hypothetical protein